MFIFVSKNMFFFRLSVAVRPQTVANLASHFDNMVQKKAVDPTATASGGNGSSRRSTNGRHVKLRTYDITSIIAELNRKLEIY